MNGPQRMACLAKGYTYSHIANDIVQLKHDSTVG